MSARDSINKIVRDIAEEVMSDSLSDKMGEFLDDELEGRIDHVDLDTVKDDILESIKEQLPYLIGDALAKTDLTHALQRALVGLLNSLAAESSK
jgi:hypothetical protein